MSSVATFLPSQAVTEESRQLTNMSAALRRLCTPKAGSGKLEVNTEVYKQWQQGGAPRKALLNLLIKSGGDKDTIFAFVCAKKRFPSQDVSMLFNLLHRKMSTLSPIRFLVQDIFSDFF